MREVAYAFGLPDRADNFKLSIGINISHIRG